MSSEIEKASETLNISGGEKLLNAFRNKAQEMYGKRGVSEAGREAFRDWLAKQGVRFVDEDPVMAQSVRIKKVAALEELGVNVDELLDRALVQAGQPTAAVA